TASCARAACALRDTVTSASEIYTLSLHDALPIFEQEGLISEDCEPVDINETPGYLTDNTNGQFTETKVADKAYDYDGLWLFWWRSEEHTSELQSRFDIVCRLLLEKKKKKVTHIAS